MSDLLSRSWQKVNWGKLSAQPNAVFLGSCFSTEIAHRAKDYGWKVVSNPMGTLFQPLVIADWIRESVGQSVIKWEEHCIQHEDQVKCLMSGKLLNGNTKGEVLSKIHQVKEQLASTMENAELLVVTFGTAYAWKYLPTGSWVGNCQRIQQQDFQRELIPLERLENYWKETVSIIRNRFPKLKIIFTVSPVRHEKLGVMENARSKAILLELCHRLQELESVCYFPSYEWITDELRDYAYYQTDGCRPSDAAIDFVFQKWIQTFQINEKI